MIIHVDMLLIKVADVLQIDKVSLMRLVENICGKLRSPIRKRKRACQTIGGGNDFCISKAGTDHKDVIQIRIRETCDYEYHDPRVSYF